MAKSIKNVRLFAGLSKSSKAALLVFILIFALVGSVVFNQINAAPRARINGVSLYLTPSGQTVSEGHELSLQVWVDSQAKQINAVQADLTYDQNHFDFVSIESTGSAFSIDAQSTGGAGVVSIARGNIEPLTGKNLIATVKLQAKAKTKKTTIQFTTNSVVAEVGTAQNILVSRSSGSYRLN